MRQASDQTGMQMDFRLIDAGQTFIVLEDFCQNRYQLIGAGTLIDEKIRPACTFIGTIL